MTSCIDAASCDTEIFQECYENNRFTNDTFFCECSNWFGWTGNNCDSASATVYYFGVAYSFFFFWTLFNLFTLGRVLFLLIRSKHFKGKNTNPVFFVALLSFLASLCLLIRFFIRTKTLYDPGFFEVAEADSLVISGTRVQRKFSNIASLLFAGGWILQALACLQMLISWLDVFDHINEIFPLKTTISDKTLKIIITVTIVIVCLFFFILASLNAVVEVTFGYTICAIILAVGFVIGYCRFRNGLKRLLEGNLGTQEKRAVKLVKTAVMINAVCFSGVVVFSLVYYYGLTNHLEILRIGGFNYFFLLVDIGLCFGYVTTTYASYYSFKVAVRIISPSHAISWIPYSSSCSRKTKSVVESQNLSKEELI